MTNSGSTKKSVSFPDQVVSVVHTVERNDKSLNDILFYSPEDYLRFKMERRQRKAQNQRASCRRKGVMYDNLMARKGCIEHQVTRMNYRNMMIRLQPNPPMQAF